jgi:hypothetical protein
MTHTIRPKLKAQCKRKRRKAKRRGHVRSKGGGKRLALAARASVR